MLYRDLVAEVGQALLEQFGDERPSWRVHEVMWDAGSAAPPEELRELGAALAASADLHQISPMSARDSGATLNVAYGGQGSASIAIAVPVWLDAVDCLVEFASQLQDHVWESAEAWGLPLPRCPDTPGHPMVPKRVGKDAVWWCEHCGRVRTLIDR
jgi:hypothetical protein